MVYFKINTMSAYNIEITKNTLLIRLDNYIDIYIQIKN